MDWNRLLPKVTESYRGPAGPFYFLILVTVVNTARSLVHIFAPDGGASSIAGLDASGAGGANLIALFGQWGAVQLLLALIYWIVIARYRFLTPLALALLALEQALRIGVGFLKPIEVATPPPGAYGSYILLPLAVIALVWSLQARPRRPPG